MQNRPPIVVVMGHIDHGKTTLLDYIRKSAAPPGGEPRPVAGRESGGITQHIGAYEVDHNGKGLTFLDTPGHEAFGKMRSRGAKVADIAVLVVAADDGVKPQTKEALEVIKAAAIPFAVAINKIDKPSADPERVKNELAELEVFLEGRGGIVPYVEISAKQGVGVNKLLETILLLADLENITANPNTFASGVIIESRLDAKRGITSTILATNGRLKKGEYIVAGDAVAKIKILENFKGEAIDSAGPSQPAVVVGFDKLPVVGGEFRTFFSQKEAMEAARKEKLAPRSSTSPGEKPGFLGDSKPGFKEGDVSLGIVIKSDVLGSAEAIEHEMAKLKNDRLDIKILRAEAGDVSEDDVKMAASSANPVIIAFKVYVSAPARELAGRMGTEIAEFQIIYEVADFLKNKLDALAPKEITTNIIGRATILKIFPNKTSQKGQIVGGEILDGILKRGADFDIIRRGKKIGNGKIENLQQGKLNVAEIQKGTEFGALVNAKISLAEKDELDLF